MKTKLLFVLSFLIVLLLLISSCASAMNGYDEIKSYFNNNRETLENISFSDVPPPLSKENKQFIIDTLGKDSIVQRISCRDDNKYIVFTCSATGGVLVTEKTGFYYSKNDVFYGLEFNDLPYKNNGNERTYFDNDDESFLRIIRITDNWYYFYMKWY